MKIGKQTKELIAQANEIIRTEARGIVVQQIRRLEEHNGTKAQIRKIEPILRMIDQLGR